VLLGVADGVIVDVRVGKGVLVAVRDGIPVAVEVGVNVLGHDEFDEAAPHPPFSPLSIMAFPIANAPPIQTKATFMEDPHGRCGLLLPLLVSATFCSNLLTLSKTLFETY
jgi:hypothetical protein